MYNTQQEFASDYALAQNAAQGFHGSINQTKAVNSGIGWAAYSNARNPAMGFHLFGRHIKAKDTAPLRRDQVPNLPGAAKGPTLGQLPKGLTGISLSKYDAFLSNFGVVNNQKDGSILMMGGGNWNFTINDSWLIGGIHSELAFYSCSPLKSFNLVDHEYVLTITGRELLGLALAGYVEESGHADMGVAFTCDDKAKAQALTLPDIQLAVADMKTPMDAMSVFANAGFSTTW
jgi:hypothetical protein